MSVFNLLIGDYFKIVTNSQLGPNFPFIKTTPIVVRGLDCKMPRIVKLTMWKNIVIGSLAYVL